MSFPNLLSDLAANKQGPVWKWWLEETGDGQSQDRIWAIRPSSGYLRQPYELPKKKEVGPLETYLGQSRLNFLKII